jgi:hypothetical protein
MITGTIIRERCARWKGRLAVFPGQRGCECSVGRVMAARLMEAKHLISDIGDHLSRIGWVNSLRLALHGQDGLLIIP